MATRLAIVNSCLVESAKGFLLAGDTVVVVRGGHAFI